MIINQHLSAKIITKAAGVERSQRLLPLIINFLEFWNQPLELVEGFLKKWYYWATHSRIEPIKEAACTIKRQRNHFLSESGNPKGLVVV